MGNVDSSAFPYTIGEEVTDYRIYKTCWDMFDAKETSTGSPVTVFTFDKEKHGNRIDSAKNYMTILRTLRFPTVIKYINAVETPQHIHIVTERLRPLILPFAPEPDEQNTVYAVQLSSPETPQSSSQDISVEAMEEKSETFDFAGKPLDSSSTEALSLLFAAGLHQVTSALDFLNNKAFIVHGNINPSSIFLSAEGDWKVGGFDIAFRVPLAHAQTAGTIGTGNIPELTRSGAGVQRQAYMCPELKGNRWRELEAAPLHAIDAYALGVLINHCYNIDLRQLDGAVREGSGAGVGSAIAGRSLAPISLPLTLQQVHRQLLSSAAAARPTYATVLASPFFFNQVVSTLQYLSTINLKTLEENSQFFKNLLTAYSTMPIATLRHKILPELVSLANNSNAAPTPTPSTLSSFAFTTTAAPAPAQTSTSGAIAASTNIPFAQVLSCILHVAKFVQTPQEYAQQVIPIITRLFQSNDRAVRVHLLQNVREYSRSLTSKTLNREILAPLLTGLRDSHPVIRELTIKALPPLAHYLSADTIQTTVLPQLTVLQADTHPQNRVHVVLCVAKLAQHLPRQQQEQLLLPVFARGLKDPFADARKACLLGLLATVEVYPAEVCARKILPYVCPYLLDGSAEVRAHALKLVRVLVERLEKHQRGMGDGPASAVAGAVGAPAAPSVENMAAVAAPSPAASAVTIAGYAVPVPVSTKAISSAASSLMSSVGSWAATAVTNALVSGTGVSAAGNGAGGAGQTGGAGVNQHIGSNVGVTSQRSSLGTSAARGNNGGSGQFAANSGLTGSAADLNNFYQGSGPKKPVAGAAVDMDMFAAPAASTPATTSASSGPRVTQPGKTKTASSGSGASGDLMAMWGFDNAQRSAASAGTGAGVGTGTGMGTGTGTGGRGMTMLPTQDTVEVDVDDWGASWDKPAAPKTNSGISLKQQNTDFGFSGGSNFNTLTPMAGASIGDDFDFGIPSPPKGNSANAFSGSTAPEVKKSDGFDDWDSFLN